MITTWHMAVEGITKGAQMLENGGDTGDAIESIIQEVEDFPYYRSVGCGGLPNEKMEVKMDATLMDGNTLDMNAVAATGDFANPVSITRRLGHEKVNSLLVVEGAEKFTHKEEFERRNMLTDRAKAHCRKRIKEMSAQAAIRAAPQRLEPYSGHDTVGMACLDMTGRMTAATSTSGLFMKKRGRVGDSPISGSEFYANSKKGAASATGLGEGLIRDCISYETVRFMGEGMHPRETCETAVPHLDAELRERGDEAGDSSLIVINSKGEWSVTTSIEGFSFTVTAESQEPTAYLVTRQEDDRCTYERAPDEWMENYMKTRMAPVEEQEYG